MKQLVAVAVLLLVGHKAALSQQPADPVAKNSAFLEIAGNGGLASLNYERSVAPGLQLRIGWGNWSEDTQDDFATYSRSYNTFPIMLSGVLYPGNHHLELGGGVTLGREAVDSAVVLSQRTTFLRTVTTLESFVGYRRQPPGGGFVWRLGLTPSYSVSGDYPDTGFHLGAGFSAGWAF